MHVQRMEYQEYLGTSLANVISLNYGSESNKSSILSTIESLMYGYNVSIKLNYLLIISFY